MISRSWTAAWLAGAVLTVTLAGCSSTPAAQPEPTAAVPVTSAAPTVPASSEPVPSGPSTAPATSATPNRPSTSGPKEPPPNGTFTGVRLVRTGGIAGSTETTTVLPDGSWTLQSTRAGTRSGKLVSTQRSRLQSLLNDPRLAAEAARRNTGTGQCSDAFTYLLIAGRQKVQYTSCGQTDKPETTVAVISLLQSATKRQ